MKLHKKDRDTEVSYSDFNETILEQGGESFQIRVGNTVIDIMHGYNNSGYKEPCAIVDIYPYDNKDKSRILVRDNQRIILSR